VEKSEPTPEMTGGAAPPAGSWAAAGVGFGSSWRRRVQQIPGVSAFQTMDQWEIFNILKWRYCTIFQAICCGDIPVVA